MFTRIYFMAAVAMVIAASGVTAQAPDMAVNSAAEISTTTLVIVRHGETDWNVQGILQGHADIPLNDTGREEARRQATTLSDYTFDACYASDLSRSHETAEIIAETLDLEVLVDLRLRERDYGQWVGSTYAPFHAYRESGGEGEFESDKDLRERVLSVFDEIVKQHPGETVLVVSHGGPQRVIITELIGCSWLDVKPSNTGFVELDATDGQYSLKRLEGIEVDGYEPPTHSM